MLFLIDLFFSNLRPSAITPSVNGKLSKNNFADAVKLNAYTESNPYVIPSDGYVSIQFSGILRRMVAVVNIAGSSTTGSNSFGKVTDVNYYASYQNEVVAVRKGMKVYPTYISDSSEISIYFKAFV